MRYLLVDNGSLRPSSILNLRRIAHELGKATGLEILPSSLLHSSKVPAEQLDGKEAINLERRLRRFLEAGERDFTIIPFFFGKTGAITDYLPERLAFRREKHGDFKVWRTPFVAEGQSERTKGLTGHKRSGDLVEILADRVREVMEGRSLLRPRVVLCDHGSPKREIAALRDALAIDLADMLGKDVEAVAPASMERREGEEYAFTEPLLEKLLRQDAWNQGNVIVAMLFLSPGRHAGPGGDVDTICRKAEEASPDLNAHMTGLVGDHPGIIPLLQQRLEMERILM